MWVGPWSLVIGHWSLVIGHWSFVLGHWSLVIGHWSLVIGCWSLVPRYMALPWNALLEALPPGPNPVLKPTIARVMAEAMTGGITTEVVTTNRNGFLDVLLLGPKTEKKK